MKIVELEQNTPEWEIWRKNHIGSSDAAIIMELNPYKTKLQLWEEKCLGWTEIHDQNAIDRMAEGTRMEPIARQAFIERTGIVLEPQVGVHSDYDFLSASFDGISEDHQVIVEIKCGKKAYQMAQYEIIPDYYLCQMAHQMMIAGAHSSFYFAFYEGDGIMMEIMRDQTFIEKMIAKEIEFWNCICTFTSPEESKCNN